MRKILIILVLVILTSIKSYSYGGPLGNNFAVLNQSCSVFCLYEDPVSNPGTTRNQASCSSLGSVSQCGFGIASSSVDPCSIAYGIVASNTFSPFGYPTLSGTANFYGEAVCKCFWNGNACLPDPSFNPVSVDIGDAVGGVGGSFCDVTGSFSGVAGDVILDRGYCSQEPVRSNVTDDIIENQISNQGPSLAHAINECECDSDYNSDNGVDHICNTQRAGFSDCTRNTPLAQIQRKRLVSPGGSCVAGITPEVCDNIDNDCNGIIDDKNNNRIADSVCTYYYSCDLRYLECSKQNCNGVDYPLSPFNTLNAYGYGACSSPSQTSCSLLVDYIVGGGNTIGRRFCNTSISEYAVGTNFYTCNKFNYTFNGCGLDKGVCNKTNLLSDFANVTYTNTESYTNNNDCSKCGSAVNGCVSYTYVPSLIGSGINTHSECTRSVIDMDSSAQACNGCAGYTRWSPTGDYDGGNAGCCGDDPNEVYVGDQNNPGVGTCCKRFSNATAVYNSSFVSSGFCDYKPKTTCIRQLNNTLDIVFATDESGSMFRTDPAGLRHQSVIDLIDKLNTTLDKVAFIPWGGPTYFSTQLFNTVNLTSDFSFAKTKISSTTYGPRASTFFDLGLNYSLNQFYNYSFDDVSVSLVHSLSSFARENSTKVIMFLSDGEPSFEECVAYTPPGYPPHTYGYFACPGVCYLNPLCNLGSQVDRAVELNITVYTIGLGLENTICPSCARGNLSELANLTGGLYFESASTENIAASYNDIAERLITCVQNVFECAITSVYWTNNVPSDPLSNIFAANSSNTNLVITGNNCEGLKLIFSNLKEVGGNAIPSEILNSFNSETSNAVFDQKLGEQDMAVVTWNAQWFGASGKNPQFVFDVGVINANINSSNSLEVYLLGGPPIGRYIPDTQVVITREGECKDIGNNDGTGTVNETWRRINTTTNEIVEGPITYEKACFLKKGANVPFFSLINVGIVILILLVYYTVFLKKNKKIKAKKKK